MNTTFAMALSTLLILTPAAGHARLDTSLAQREAAPPQPPPAPAPPARGAKPAPPIPPPTPPLPAATQNIKLDLTITDTYSGKEVKKTVTMLVLERQSGRIRTSNHNATLNVDADVNAVGLLGFFGSTWPKDLIAVSLTFVYMPPPATENTPPPSLNESLTVVLQNGKPMLVSQSADPVTDRRVTVELMATIMK